MAIKVTLKNSVVQNSVPTTSHLAAVGELALNANINSLGIYMRASDNSIVKMAGPGSVTTPAASTTVAGIAELATSAETTTGTDTARVTTPAGVKAVTDAERTTSNNTYLALAGGTVTGVLAATAGSNSAASIHFGDTDSGLFGGTNTVSLTAGGTTRLTADTGVSVVGTLAVTGAITSTSDLTIADKIIHAGDTNTAIRFPAADTVSIETAGSETLRVDSGGRLLIGTSSEIGIANNSLSHLQMAWTDKSASMGISRFSANTSPPSFNFAKARGGSVGTMTIVQENDDLGEINFCGADGADFGNVSARIRVAVDGTPATDDIPGRIEIYTFKASNNTLTEALRITNDGIVRVPDNGKFTAGASNDISLFHDGLNSYLSHNGTGDLFIDADGSQENINLRSKKNVNIYVEDKTELAIKCNESGAVELYYDAVKKLETTSAGVSTTGTSLHTDNIKITVDNGAFYCGAGDDLKIYHDGSNSYISDIGTGGLGVTSNHFWVADAANGEYLINAVENGAVELYFDNSKKLYTHSGGVAVTGELAVSDSVTLADGDKIRFGHGYDLEIYHDGSHSYIEDSGTGDIVLKSDTTRIINAAGDENIARFLENGAVELYYDGTKKLETTSTGTETAGYNKSFLVKSDSAFGSTSAHVIQSNNNNQVALVVEHSGDTNPYGIVISFSDDDPDNNGNYFLKCEDSSNTNRLFIYSDGDIHNHDNSYTSSDATLKENIVDATSKLEDLKKLKVRNFNWKADHFPEKSKKKQLGFIAQEVEEVFPALVSEHDIAAGIPGDGHVPLIKKAIKQAWDPIIIKAMQELIAKVETLETKVAALEAA